MDLFVVNRYFGDNVKENNDSDEKAKLALFLSKIEERRKKKEALFESKSSDLNFHINEDADVTASLKPYNEIKKSLAASTDGETVDKIENVHVSESKDAGVTGKTKHNRKRKEISDSDHNEGNLLEDIKKNTVERVQGFTVIGTDKFKKKQKVKRVLPHWLANPSVVSVNLQQLTTTVKDVRGLDKDIVRTLKKNKITHFFPVQAQVIPWLLAAHSKPTQYWPHDICVSAPTGSGKTLAFVIPIIQALRHRMVVQIRALVVLPVQDLAVQVHHVFFTYAKNTNLRVALITGQTAFQKEQQELVALSAISGYHSLVDIVVTTPGRLVDHLQSTPGFTLKHLRFLVIDEADRVLENVQNDWLYHLYSHIDSTGRNSCHPPALTISTLESTAYPPPQKLLFSATLTQDPEKLQHLGLFQPKLFTSVVGNSQIEDEAKGTDDAIRGDFVGKYTTPAELSEWMCVVTPESKPLVLYHIIKDNSWHHVLVFVGSRKEAHRLSLLLSYLGQGNLKVAEISSSLSRVAREKILAKFAKGDIDMLVSSDALARGMDIPGVGYVVLYNAPKSIKNYIHRVGRTGRAGKCGSAVTLLLENQVAHFNGMLQTAGKDSLQEFNVDDTGLLELEDNYKCALERLKINLEKEENQRLRAEKRSKKFAPLVQKSQNQKGHLKVRK